MILIVGAGLSGLLTAYRLKQQGIPFKILEARNRVGGRIHTLCDSHQTPVEMGATWFGEKHQHLRALLEELQINSFPQYMAGTVFFQPFSTSPAQSIQIPAQPPSYRISGGSSALIDRLFSQLDPNDVLTGQEVKEIRFKENTVQVLTDRAIDGSSVVLALPPKLWARKIVFQPALPEPLMQIAKMTHTWMEDSIKIAVSYNSPFWRENNHSGTLFSNTGPVTELYDHCDHENTKYALCGFVNPAFKNLPLSERRDRVIGQLKAVFGIAATSYLDYSECVWSREEFTFQDSDSPVFPHQNNGHPAFRKTYLEGRLHVCSSEAASDFPGYMDGAVQAANAVAQRLAAAIKSNL
jgi:monoamine oxidase